MQLALPVTTRTGDPGHSEQQPILLSRSDFDVPAQGKRASKKTEEKPMSAPVATAVHNGMTVG
jgi:hypothetical protein